MKPSGHSIECTPLTKAKQPQLADTDWTTWIIIQIYGSVIRFASLPKVVLSVNHLSAWKIWSTDLSSTKFVVFWIQNPNHNLVITLYNVNHYIHTSLTACQTWITVSSKASDNFLSYSMQHQWMNKWTKKTNSKQSIASSHIRGNNCPLPCYLWPASRFHRYHSIIRCSSGRVGLNLSRGYCALRSTQPSIPPGSINE